MGLSFFSLIQSVRVTVCLEWITLDTLALLDSATPKQYRERFLNDIALRYAVQYTGPEKQSMSFISWIVSHKISISTFTFPSCGLISPALGKLLKTSWKDKITVLKYNTISVSFHTVASAIGYLTALKEIHMASISPMDIVFIRLIQRKTLINIEVLNLIGCNLQPNTMIEIVHQCPLLRDISIRNGTDDVMDAITGLTDLLCINIDTDKLQTTDGLRKLFESHSFTSVVVVCQETILNRKVNAVDIVEIIALNCSQLQTFKPTLGWIESRCEDYLKQFVENCKNLTCLDLSHAPGICSENNMEALAKNHTNLKEFKMCFEYIGTVIAGHIFTNIFAANPYLVSVLLSHYDTIDDNVVISLGEYCPYLEELIIRSCTITNNGILELAKRCSKLRILDIGCSRCSSNIVVEISKYCTNLETIHNHFGFCLNEMKEIANNCKKLRLMTSRRGYGIPPMVKTEFPIKVCYRDSYSSEFFDDFDKNSWLDL